MRPLTTLVLLAATAAGTVFAQANQKSLVFEVASIKPNVSGEPSRVVTAAGGRLTATNVSLRMLVQYAFGVKEYEIAGGPGWTGTEKYDVIAQADTPNRLSETELGPILQTLLAGRFNLKYHRETRDLAGYSLVVSPKGPRLTEHTGTETTAPSVSTTYDSGVVTMTARQTSMKGLANSLGRQLGRTVADETALQGVFDLTLAWAPQPTTESSDPSIFTAIEEQLGLKLKSHSLPVEIVVIDSAEKPSEN